MEEQALADPRSAEQAWKQSEVETADDRFQEQDRAHYGRIIRNREGIRGEPCRPGRQPDSCFKIEGQAREPGRADWQDSRGDRGRCSGRPQREKAPDTVYAEIRGMERNVDILVNNAGVGTYGQFHTLSADEDHKEVMLNVVALVRLTHLFLPAMVERGQGTVVNIASAAAFQPAPYMAVYGASKAFVLSFSEALWAEYRQQGVHVLAVCPGP